DARPHRPAPRRPRADRRGHPIGAGGQREPSSSSRSPSGSDTV
ncbi:MAG: hypothetical protein AVDCRST_MAG60-454, partial [uncultured Nocardioides sp.]